MWNLKFAKMFDNNIFTKYGLKPVAEDYFKAEKNAFSVTDGVTRDDINGNTVPYPKNEEEVRNWLAVYPNPSGAFEAAKIAADTFVELALKENELSKEKVMELAKKSNEAIWKINEGRKIDYLKEDLYCCEAVGGIISNDKLYCYSIGDCHISVFDEDYNLLFTTNNNHKDFEDYLFNVYSKTNHYDWNEPNSRIMIRRDFRNKPDKKYNGKDISFGALSGEKEAEYYIDSYEVDLSKAKYICAYSDGYEPNFADRNETIELLNNPEKTAEKGKERTLVIYTK